MRCARKSSKNPTSDDVRLIKYLIKHKHMSPFEMASMCVDIETSRTIARQILRHRSFSFQEFSQRYQDIEVVGEDRIHWQARKEHPKNRQSSTDTATAEEQVAFDAAQQEVWASAITNYRKLVRSGIAREQARCVLPEGLTKTKMAMSGTLRSWIHYIDLRTQPDTQQEHRVLAEAAKEILLRQCPHICAAMGWSPL